MTGWDLPEALEIAGRSEPIRADFREVLEVIRLLDDAAEPPEARAFLAMGVFYRKFAALPPALRGQAMEAMLRFLAGGEEDSGPAGPRLLDWQLEEGRLHLDLSDHYYSLSGVDLTLADACLALTFCQMEEVDSVYVTVEGHELPYRAAQQLSMENILLAGGADEPMSLGVDLWYLRPGGRALGVERRQIVKTVDQTLVQAVLAAWADGPEGELLSCLPQGSQIRSVEVQDGVCVVDLSQEYIDGLPRSEQTAALTVYAMVNTLCELDGVEAVQLYIDGEPAPAVGDLPLDRALIPDTSLTEAGS